MAGPIDWVEREWNDLCDRFDIPKEQCVIAFPWFRYLHNRTRVQKFLCFLECCTMFEDKYQKDFTELKNATIDMIRTSVCPVCPEEAEMQEVLDRFSDAHKDITSWIQQYFGGVELNRGWLGRVYLDKQREELQQCQQA